MVGVHRERFLKRVYTPEEAAYCRGRVNELAARFAAKEAVMKALGTGIRGVGWREIEVLPDGPTYAIAPGTLYVLDGHERHRLRAKSELRMVCVFDPPVTGREVHGPDGAYPPASAASEGGPAASEGGPAAAEGGPSAGTGDQGEPR